MSITLLREVTERVAPPRALFVDRPLGFPLGEAGNPQLQTAIITAALEMLSADIRGALLHECADVRRASGLDDGEDRFD